MKRLTLQYIVWINIALIAVVLATTFYHVPDALKKIYHINDITHEDVLRSLSECHNNEKRNTCFKQIADDFVERNALSAVFMVLEENQQTPKVFESCHVLLHFMGQSAFKKFQNVRETFRNGSHACFAGFYHGVLEGYFMQANLLLPADGNFDALKKAIPKICTDTDRSGIKKDYYECLHGVGHALMFVTDGELPQALKLCDALPASETDWCYSGTFMENSTSTTNPDHPSKYLKKDDPLYPCDILDEKYLGTCYILQSMYFAQLTNGNWQKNIDLCMRVPVDHRGACMNGFGQNIVGYSTDPEIVKENCLLVPTPYQHSCIEGAVGAIGEKYKNPFPFISRLCTVFEGGNRETCYGTTFDAMINWTADKKELENFCTSIDETKLKNTCISRL